MIQVKTAESEDPKISEVKDAKKELKSSLVDLINHYEREFGFSVDGVHIETRRTTSGGNLITGVDLEVSL